METHYTLTPEQRIAFSWEYAMTQRKFFWNHLWSLIICAIIVAVALFIFLCTNDMQPLLQRVLGFGGIDTNYGWKILDATVCGILYFAVLFIIPLKVMYAKIRTLVRKQRTDNTDFTLTTKSDSIIDSGKYGTSSVFFSEPKSLLCGKYGYYFIANDGKTVLLPIHKSAIEFETLTSLLPSHIKINEHPKPWQGNW